MFYFFQMVSKYLYEQMMIFLCYQNVSLTICFLYFIHLINSQFWCGTIGHFFLFQNLKEHKRVKWFQSFKNCFICLMLEIKGQIFSLFYILCTYFFFFFAFLFRCLFVVVFFFCENSSSNFFTVTMEKSIECSPRSLSRGSLLGRYRHK